MPLAGVMMTIGLITTAGIASALECRSSSLSLSRSAGTAARSVATSASGTTSVAVTSAVNTIRAAWPSAEASPDDEWARGEDGARPLGLESNGSPMFVRRWLRPALTAVAPPPLPSPSPADRGDRSCSVSTIGGAEDATGNRPFAREVSWYFCQSARQFNGMCAVLLPRSQASLVSRRHRGVGSSRSPARPSTCARW